MSLLGGGTDQPEWFNSFNGYVIGSTIDKYVYIILSKRFDNKIVVGYSKHEEVDNIIDIKHDLVREAAKLAGMTTGWEVKTMSDIPSGGSGLGSSSAILVGLLNAFYVYNNRLVTQDTLAEQAYYIERTCLCRPIGKQDHYYATYGGQNLFTFYQESSIITPVKITKDNLYLFYTGITRNASSVLTEQVNNINYENSTDYQNLASMAKCLAEVNNYRLYLPTYLKEAWRIKKNLSSTVTNPEIETMCELADQGGAEAYKILGAGGGGFLLVYCKNENIDKLRDTMRGYRELPFRFVDHGTRIIFNNE